MSDEEKREEVYVRHPPFYRSDALTKFISKLNKRCDKKMSTHPRVKRNVGSPAKTPTPANAKKWTVKKMNDTVSDESTRSTPRGLPTTPLADDQMMLVISEMRQKLKIVVIPNLMSAVTLIMNQLMLTIDTCG